MQLRTFGRRLVVLLFGPLAVWRLRRRMLPQREGFWFKMGLLLDHHAYEKLLHYAGEGIRIHPSVDIRCPQNVSIGAGTWVNHGTELHGFGGIDIGAGTLISFHVLILSNMRRFRDPGPIGDQPKEPRPVKIGDDAWIGAHAIVLPGVTIGDHAVVAAGAVVTRDVDPWQIVAGAPASVIGHRLEHREDAIVEA